MFGIRVSGFAAIVWNTRLGNPPDAAAKKKGSRHGERQTGIETGQPRLPFQLGSTRLALRGFVKLLADRHGPDGLRVNSISPGLMESAANEFHPEWIGHVPLGRVGQNREVGETIAFLASEAAGYITGQCLTVDGGVNRPLGL